MFRRTHVLFLLFSLILLPAVLLSGTNPIVIMKSGEVKISINEKKWQDISLKDKISIDNIIKTGKNSHAVLSFKNSLVKIKENSKIKLKSLSSSEKKKSKTSFKLFFGNVLSKISKLKKDESYEVETPTAVVGVRGTEFSVMAGKGETRVKVFEGAVKLRSLRKKGLSIMLRKNEVGSFIKGKMKKMKKKMKSGEIKKAKGEFKKIMKQKGLRKKIKKINRPKRRR